MKIRVATFNVENLFSRPKAMNFSTWAEGQRILDDFGRLTSLLNQQFYSADIKRDILRLLRKYGLTATRPQNPYLELRKIRGRLIARKGSAVTVVARGRADWVGWVELKREHVADEAIESTARIISEVNPDILTLVEVEDRPTLQRFHDSVLAPRLTVDGHRPMPFNMVIDGNDAREIDVGILSRFPIVGMRSHTTNPDGTRSVFSRDCPEYYVRISDQTELVLLPNHFASKGSDHTGERRKAQSKAVRDIYRRLRDTHPNIIVTGDLNDFPAGGSLKPLLVGTGLKDAMALPEYQGPFPGTYKHANAKQKIDYLLLSPALIPRVQAVDVFRRGFYAPTKWQAFDNLNSETKERFQASDHHCLWADIEVD